MKDENVAEITLLKNSHKKDTLTKCLLLFALKIFELVCLSIYIDVLNRQLCSQFSK